MDAQKKVIPIKDVTSHWSVCAALTDITGLCKGAAIEDKPRNSKRTNQPGSHSVS